MHRRQFGRVRTVGLTAHLFTGGRLASSLPVENLSLGGAFLRTLVPIRVGTAVGLQLHCPGRPQPLTLAGKIVTGLREDRTELRGAAGLGLAFGPLTVEQSGWLRRLLLAHAPGPAVLEGDPPLNPPQPEQRLPPPPLSGLPEPAEAAMDLAQPGSPAPPIAPMDAGRLMVQVRGLLMEVGDWRQRADALEKLGRALQAENERLKRAVAVLSIARSV